MDACLSVFPHIIRLLTSTHTVVHSYAAVALERMLSLRHQGSPRFSSADLGPLVQQLLTNLFAAFTLPESSENEYLMKCVMRVIG